MSEHDFKEGDRVVIGPEFAMAYKQPWPARIARGMTGTYKHQNHMGYAVVDFDMPARAKHPHEWRWVVSFKHLRKALEEEKEAE